MIGISADFDPVHIGHVGLIKKAREIGDEQDKKVVIYLNKGYSANHAPFFSSFEARSRMALDAGADKIVPIEGLHHRLTMAYTVPIRIALMIGDGVTDYIDAADVSSAKIRKYAARFVSQGIFSGIPRNLPNRNVIRWYAVNEFLGKVLGRKMKFHFTPELKSGEDKISGRLIRQKIKENNMVIPKEVIKLLPPTTLSILEDEIFKGHNTGQRNLEILKERSNKFSRSSLLEIAHINAGAVEEIINGRRYNRETQIWASFRKAGYGPVLTRLALSCLEEDVSRREVYDFIMDNEKKGIIPPDQTVGRVIERAWYVASSIYQGISGQEAHEKFRKGESVKQKPPLIIDGGVHLRSFELDSLDENLRARLYVDKRGMISCLIKTKKRKIKSPLKLPANEATYIRLIIDSQIIPLDGIMIHKKSGWRVRIKIG